MREGRLGYNCENGRYGLLSMAVSYTHLTLPTNSRV